MDRSQVCSIAGAVFKLKILTPSGFIFKNSVYSGISSGCHLQNAECFSQIFLFIGLYYTD
jgi:hypothetical protein